MTRRRQTEKYLFLVPLKQFGNYLEKKKTEKNKFRRKI